MAPGPAAVSPPERTENGLLAGEDSARLSPGVLLYCTAPVSSTATRAESSCTAVMSAGTNCS